jgi:TonB family protein
MRLNMVWPGIVFMLLFWQVSLSAQDSSKSEDAPSVALIEVVDARYPPLARQTRISGVVKLSVKVRPDGTVDSVDTISGHPLLEQAALDSAKKSRFECIRCTEPATAFILTYSFELPIHDEDVHPASHTADKVTITAPPVVIDGGGPITYTKVRSIKCLYLWKCTNPRIISSM